MDTFADYLMLVALIAPPIVFALGFLYLISRQAHSH